MNSSEDCRVYFVGDDLTLAQLEELLDTAKKHNISVAEMGDPIDCIDLNDVDFNDDGVIEEAIKQLCKIADDLRDQGIDTWYGKF